MDVLESFSVIVALGTLAVLLCSIWVGMYLSTIAPADYQSENAKDAVKLSIGIISTLSALVIGLLVASAKESYEAKSIQIKQIAANIILLDFVLSQYGTDAAAARQGLRASVGEMASRIWSESAPGPGTPRTAVASAESTFRAIHELPPRDERLRSLQAQAIQIATEIGKSRTLLIAQSRDSIPLPFLTILIFWLAGIFVGIGFLTRANITGFVALSTCAISVSAAIFLLLELNRPFSGIMQISNEPFRTILPSQ